MSGLFESLEGVSCQLTVINFLWRLTLESHVYAPLLSTLALRSLRKTAFPESRWWNLISIISVVSVGLDHCRGFTLAQGSLFFARAWYSSVPSLAQCLRSDEPQSNSLSCFALKFSAAYASQVSYRLSVPLPSSGSVCSVCQHAVRPRPVLWPNLSAWLSAVLVPDGLWPGPWGPARSPLSLHQHLSRAAAT